MIHLSGFLWVFSRIVQVQVNTAEQLCVYLYEDIIAEYNLIASMVATPGYKQVYLVTPFLCRSLRISCRSGNQDGTFHFEILSGSVSCHIYIYP